MKPMIELVVFDIAGTTVHDGDGVSNAFRAALDTAGFCPEPTDVRRVMGLPKPEAIRRLLAQAGGVVAERTVEAIHADFVQRMRHYYETDPSIREVPGATATFTTLRERGIKVALDTGFSRPVVDVLLRRLSWQPPNGIDAVVASDEVPHGRPYPDMIRHLMARLGVGDARKVAKVGDTQADLEEGANAGCGLVIGVTTGSFTREQLQACPHSHILESVVEVPGLLPYNET
jgi:phosphonatase-like hydrolase